MLTQVHRLETTPAIAIIHGVDPGLSHEANAHVDLAGTAQYALCVCQCTCISHLQLLLQMMQFPERQVKHRPLPSCHVAASGRWPVHSCGVQCGLHARVSVHVCVEATNARLCACACGGPRGTLCLCTHVCVCVCVCVCERTCVVRLAIVIDYGFVCFVWVI